MIAAIVQVRMTSSRLPGKALKSVSGKPLLAYLVERLSFSNLIEKIIIATTTNHDDDIVETFCTQRNLDYYRGVEHDVLDRYYRTAKKFKVDHISRISSDCPLVDPVICDKLIQKYLDAKVDFVHSGSTLAEGLDCEIFSFKALETSWNEAKLKSEREHMTLYMHNHPEKFKKITFQNYQDDSKYRFTVDDAEDYEVVEQIINNLYSENDKLPFSSEMIKTYLDENPDVYNKNAHIIRNEGLMISLKNDEEIC